jgi:hypothetical protein
MTNIKVGIIRNELSNTADDWIIACNNRNIDYQVIDLSANNWLEQVRKDNFVFYLIQPPGSYERFKTMFDERLYIICNELRLKTFPSFTESIIYENKKMLSYYLNAHNIPHPETFIFYNYDEAKNFVDNTELPFVAKTSIGASGSGVKVIRKYNEALRYINDAFKSKGIRRRFGPNRVTGSPQKWAKKSIKEPSYFLKRLKYYLEINRNTQFGYVIFQTYIPHNYEWRIVKIGEFYFAHKKIKIKDKASGAKVKQFGFPDISVMDFVEDLCNQNNFNCVCLDIFESGTGFLVNEIQCVFGIPYGYLSKVNDKIGRFVKYQGTWTFEEGDFTKNNCCDLKLEIALKLYFENKL